jgi:Fe-S-cluster-containing dehydrogenase component
MEKVMIVDVDKCTGCRACELACSVARTGEYNPQKSYIRVAKNKDMDISMVLASVQCGFCDSGDCVKACLPEAIKLVEFNEAILQWKAVKVGSMPAPLFATSS